MAANGLGPRATVSVSGKQYVVDFNNTGEPISVRTAASLVWRSGEPHSYSSALAVEYAKGQLNIQNLPSHGQCEALELLRRLHPFVGSAITSLGSSGCREDRELADHLYRLSLQADIVLAEAAGNVSVAVIYKASGLLPTPPSGKEG